jgi:hypothetical protein
MCGLDLNNALLQGLVQLRLQFQLHIFLRLSANVVRTSATVGTTDAATELAELAGDWSSGNLDFWKAISSNEPSQQLGSSRLRLFDRR